MGMNGGMGMSPISGQGMQMGMPLGLSQNGAGLSVHISSGNPNDKMSVQGSS